MFAFNGTIWGPRFDVGLSDVVDVACASTTRCVAVGTGGPEFAVAAAVYNGTTWSSTTTLSGFSQATGVSCAPSGLCLAVGSNERVLATAAPARNGSRAAAVIVTIEENQR